MSSLLPNSGVPLSVHWVTVSLCLGITMGELPLASLMPTLNMLSSLNTSQLQPLESTHISSALSSSPLITPTSHSEDKTDLVYIAEGLSPIPKKIYEKIKLWQFIHLPDLSPKSARSREEETQFLQQCDGKVLLVQFIENV